jgi:hypothetical protein
VYQWDRRGLFPWWGYALARHQGLEGHMVEGAAARAYRWVDRRRLWRHYIAQLLAWLVLVLVWLPYFGEEKGSSDIPAGPFVVMVMLFLLYALVLAAFAAVRSPVPRFRRVLLGMRDRPAVESVTPAVRRQKIVARSGVVVQIIGLAAALSAPYTRWPGALLQAAAGLSMVAAVRFWPQRGQPRRLRRREPLWDRWRRAGWRVELGERRPFAEATQTAGAVTAVSWVPVLPRTVDVRLVWAGVGVTGGAAFALLALAAGQGDLLSAAQRASLALLLLYWADRLQHLGRRIVMRGATEAMRESERPPVLLLRAFAEDTTMVRAAVSSRRSLPGTTLPVLGAATEATTGERWTELVGGWMRRASMVVVVAPPREVTPGLRWELDAISAVGAWSRTVLVLPPVHGGEVRRRWTSFEPVLTAALGRPVRPSADLAAALAAVVEADGLLTVIAAEKSEWSYPSAVRAARRHLAQVPAVSATAGQVTLRDGAQSGDQSPLPPPPEQPPAPIAQWVPPPRVPSRPPSAIATVLASQRTGPRQVAQESFEFQSAWAAQMALMLLIVSLISLMIWPLGIVALLGGRRRLRKLRESAYPLPGRGAATAAVVLGTITTLLTAYVVVLIVKLLLI